MTLKKILIGMAVLATALLSGRAQAEDASVLATPQDRQNYSMGVDIARSLKRQAGAVNLDILLKGMKDELMGEKLLLTEEELHYALAEREAEMPLGRKEVSVKRVEKPEKAEGESSDSANADPNKNARAVKENPVQKADQLARSKAGTSVVDRYEVRRAGKKRAAEMRRKAIEQERQVQQPQGAI